MLAVFLRDGSIAQDRLTTVVERVALATCVGKQTQVDVAKLVLKD